MQYDNYSDPQQYIPISNPLCKPVSIFAIRFHSVLIILPIKLGLTSKKNQIQKLSPPGKQKLNTDVEDL